VHVEEGKMKLEEDKTETKPEVKKVEKKNYIIARGSHFSYYYANLLYEFSNMKGFENMLNVLSSKERPSPEVVHTIFVLLNSSSNLFHKEYIKELASEMLNKTSKYLSEMTQNELRNIKKESIDLITRTLKMFISHSESFEESSNIIENFGISLAIKMLKTTFLEKRIQAIRTIVEVINSSKLNPEKSAMVVNYNFHN